MQKTGKAMQSEYEIISHNNANFHIFVVNLLYRTPHLHKDYEIDLILDGEVTLINPELSLKLQKGDVFVMNPFFSHELKAENPTLILSLQVSQSLFAPYYPQIEQTEFDDTLLSCTKEPECCNEAIRLLFRIAFTYYRQEPYCALKCASFINQLFVCLLASLSHHLVSDREQQSIQAKGRRIRRILHYIEDHYTEKILLADIARQEDLDLYYLSHFFKNAFGTTFQEYIMKLRCEKARQLLLLTDYSLLDISISCGFSDAKYFNKGFLAQYGYTPKEYRSSFRHAKLEQQQKSMLTTQEFLSDTASLVTLEKYLEQISSDKQ